MGRLKGGYLGGSTIISPGKASGSADEGPVAALERARIENSKRVTEVAAREAARKSADAKLKIIERAIDEAALILRKSLDDLTSPTTDPVRLRLIAIREKFAPDFDEISSAGPNQRRRLKVAQSSLTILIGCAADAFLPRRERKELFEGSTLYQTRIRYMR